MGKIVLEPVRLEALLDKMAGVTAMVVGDVCLDAYWMADMRLSSLSRETPHHNMPVVEERYALGGAGNVMANMGKLGAKVLPVTVLGRDWRGGLTRHLMAEQGFEGPGLLDSGQRVTPTYVKPYRMGYGGACSEDPRLDFENRRALDPQLEAQVIHAIEEATEAQVIAVSDQMDQGVVTPAVRQALIRQARGGRKVVVDSRARIGDFSGCIVKPNELESARAAGLSPEQVTAEDYAPVARKLSQITGGPVIITLGGAGALCLDGQALDWAPAVPVPPPIDIVGAGDSFLSACALALGAGASLAEAIALANLASAVTIQKIGQTGTASAQEIKEQCARARKTKEKE